MPKIQTVIVSILNWNTAKGTLDCINAILAMQSTPFLKIEIIVIDNGSAFDDWTVLKGGINPAAVSLIRQEQNLGFAGGHNISIRLAVEKNADFIWLVNSDALIAPTTLPQLITVMEENPSCGAVSPVIKALHDAEEIDFCGAQHDWKNLDSIRPNTIAELRQREASNPNDMWLAGTVVLYRIAALRVTGPLDEKLFAYFEDDDIGARLSQDGWISRVAINAAVGHAKPNIKERAPYYFYLLYRNSFLFWLKHTPPPYQRLIRLRLLDRALFTANRLYRRGAKDKAEACLLGAVDGYLGRNGAPDLSRRPPILIRFLRHVFLLKQFRLLRKIEP